MAFVKAYHYRATGQHQAGRLAEAVSQSRASSMSSESVSEVFCVASGPVPCIALDAVSGRFLLTVDTKANVLLHDTFAPATRAPNGPPAASSSHSAGGVYSPLNRYPRSQGAGSGGAGRTPPLAGHNRSISCVTWFPVDCGMFLTGASDNRVLAWDTSRFNPAYAFPMEARVHCLSVSPVGGSHCLVAAGMDDPRVRLIDLSTGGHTHTLIGHRDAVLALAWSPSHEYQLASGSRDGSVRLWDVRKSGATAQLAVLDQHVGPGQRALALSGTGPSTAPTEGGATWAALGEGAKGGATNPTPGAAGAPSLAHAGGVNGLAFPPGPVTGAPLPLISTGADSTVRCWNVTDTRTGSRAAGLMAGGVNRAQEDGVADEGALLDGAAGGLMGWNSLRGYPAVVNRQRARSLFLCLARYGRGVTHVVAFHPNHNGTTGAAAGEGGSGTVSALDIDTGESLGVLRGHTAGVNACAWSESAHCLYSAGDDGRVLRWWPSLMGPRGKEEDGEWD